MRYEEDNPYYLKRNSQKKYNSDFDYMNRNTGCASCENNSIDPDDNKMVPLASSVNAARPMGGHMGGPMGGHMGGPMGGHMGGPMGGHMGGPMWHPHMGGPMGGHMWMGGHMMHPHMWHPHMWHNNFWNNGFIPIVPTPAIWGGPLINPLINDYDYDEDYDENENIPEPVFAPVGDMTIGMRIGMDDNMINSQNLSYSSALISTPIVSRRASEIFD